MHSIVVPDLHGTRSLLEAVLERFPERHLIFLGDLIHRGPDSAWVLRTALERAEAGRAVLLCGNHESWVWEDMQEESTSTHLEWWQDLERELLKSYLDLGLSAEDWIADVWRFAALAQPYHVESEMLCAHAARPSFSGNTLELYGEGHLWDRPNLGLHPLPTHLFPELTYSVHGHTVFSHPVVDFDREGVVYLDLGGWRSVRFCVWDAEARAVVWVSGGEVGD